MIPRCLPHARLPRHLGGPGGKCSSGLSFAIKPICSSSQQSFVAGASSLEFTNHDEREKPAVCSVRGTLGAEGDGAGDMFKILMAAGTFYVLLTLLMMRGMYVYRRRD